MTGICKKCGIQTSRLCNVCGNCSSKYCGGCNCFLCASCGKMHKSGPAYVCESCHKCKLKGAKISCQCKGRPGWIETKPYSGVACLNTLRRTIGVEVELATWGSVESWSPKTFRFSITHDGSVEPSGKEMVVPPMQGDQFVASMTELADALSAKKATINKSCGFHVHVGAHDLSVWSVRRLLKMYFAVQDDVYANLVEPARKRNRFCAALDRKRFDESELWKNPSPLDDADKRRRSVKYALLAGMYGKDGIPDARCGENSLLYESYKALKYSKYASVPGSILYGHNTRYAGLNLHSWLHRGTVEWRMHEGTLAVEELVCWPLWCGWFTELASRLTDAQAARVSGLESLMALTWQSGLAGRGAWPAFLKTWVRAKTEKKPCVEYLAVSL